MPSQPRPKTHSKVALDRLATTGNGVLMRPFYRKGGRENKCGVLGLSPEGAGCNSPGATPRDHGPTNDEALKGRHSPGCAGGYVAPLGLGLILCPFPGRCPGLLHSAPAGLKFRTPRS